jgi:predicted dehydrogenase
MEPHTHARETIRIGLLGAGGFCGFASHHFAQVPGVEIAGVADLNPAATQAIAEAFDLPGIDDVDGLVARSDIDLIYVSTPPFLHYSQSMKALRAGKHVIVEKPTALTLAQADEMLALAEQTKRLMVTNLMQRYNPLFETVTELVRRKPLGEFIHGYFENYAADEGLGPEHWFWNRERSGGIFIEHAVHFFDMFEAWLGEGEIVAAQRTMRPGSGIEEQVNCTIRYRDGMLVNMYHGFTQAARMDRQEARLLFERGDLTLDGWIPIRARIHALADERSTRELVKLFPRAGVETGPLHAAGEGATKARHKTLAVDRALDLDQGLGTDKPQLYGEMLRSMLADQVAWIRDRSHKRKIVEQNGRASLAMAVRATLLADLAER